MYEKKRNCTGIVLAFVVGLLPAPKGGGSVYAAAEQETCNIRMHLLGYEHDQEGCPGTFLNPAYQGKEEAIETVTGYDLQG